MLANIIFISLIGSLLNLDERAVAQIMVSRPIVVSPLIGFVLGLALGNPQDGLRDGLLMGALLELIWIKDIPIGAYVPPNACLASTLGIGLNLMIEGERILVMMISLSLAILFGSVLRWVEIKNRSFNNILATYVLRGVKEGRFARIERMNILSILVTFLIGVLVLAVALFIGVNLGQIIIGNLPISMHKGLVVSYYLLPLVGIGAAFETFFRLR